MSELLKKYESLDQSKLNEGTIKILNRVKTITADFTADDAKNNKIAEDVLNEVMKKNPNAVKIVKRTPKAKPAPKKVAKSKAPTTTSTAKGSGNNIMSVAKEIRKAGETFKDAMERAKQVLKERREGVVAKKKSELEKLYALVKTKKELQGFSKSDIERDAVRTAKKTGARFVTKEGTTSNGYGTFDNKIGRKYWETRDRHADRLAPNYPKDTPLLASGGAVNDAPFMVFVYKSKLRFDNELPSASKDEFPSFAKAKEFAIDMIDNGNYYATIHNKRGNLWGVDSKGVEQFADGGSIDAKWTYIKSSGEYILTKGEKQVRLGYLKNISFNDVSSLVDELNYNPFENYAVSFYLTKLSASQDMSLFDSVFIGYETEIDEDNRINIFGLETPIAEYIGKMKKYVKEYVIEEDEDEYANGGSFAPNVSDGTAFMDNAYFASGGDISVYNLRKGDKVKTRKGDIETILRKTGSGSYETVENDYSHSPESLEFVSRPSRKMADGGGIRSQEELNKIISEKDEKVKGLTPKQVAEMWNENSFGVKEGISKPITVEEAKSPTMKMYLRNLLIENELTEDEYNEYFESGGSFAPNVFNGTQFMNGVYADGGAVKRKYYFRDAKELSKDEKFELDVIRGLAGMGNDGISLQKLQFCSVLSKYRLGESITQSYAKKVEKALDSLIKKGFVERKGFYKNTRLGLDYLSEFNPATYANGGSFAPNVSDGTQFMNGVYGHGGGIDGGMNNLTIQNVSFADGGSVSNLIRMYNFLKEDLLQLEEAIKSGDMEEVNRFFSYWLGSSGHLKSLQTMNNQRMYMFLQEDLNRLMLAVENNDNEEIERFFSYWLGSSGHLVSIISSDIVPLVQSETAKIWKKNNAGLTAGVPPENFEKNWRKTQDEAIEKLKNEGKLPEDLKFEDIGFMTKNFEKGGIFYKEGSNKYGLGNTEIFVQEENDMYCVYDNVYNDENENWEIKKLADFDTMDEAKEFAIEHSKKSFANGGSLPFMTDPNFGNFQNTGAFANGGSIGDLTEQEFLKKYFGVNVFAENPSQYFEIKKMSSDDDAKVSAFVKELKADGFTVKKRAYSDFTSVMGVKKKVSFADGGYFDKLEEVKFVFNVGEKIKIPQMGSKGKLEFLDAEIIEQYPAEQNDGTYYPFYYVKGMWENAGKMLYDEEKLLEYGNNPKNSFELGGAFMTTDLAGHTGGGTGGLNADMPLSGVSGTYYTGLVGETGAMSSGELFMDGGAMAQNQQVIDGASQNYVITESFGNPAQQIGMLAKGGSIKDQYEGRTPEDIWNNLSKQQRGHFIYDHVSEIEEYKNIERLPSSEIIKAYNSEWSSLDKDIKNRFSNHTREGQYAYGGRTKSRPSMRKLYIEQIAFATNTRTVGVDAFAKEHNLTDSELSNLMMGLGRKMISQSDFVTALVGNKNNPKQKEVVAFAKSNKAYKMADGGALKFKVGQGEKYFDKREKMQLTIGRESDIPNVYNVNWEDGENSIYSADNINFLISKGVWKKLDKMADGGSFAPNVADGTQFMNGVYAEGGGMEQEQEYLVVLQHSETGDLMNFNVLGNNKENAIDNAYMEADLNQPYEVYSVKKYANGGSFAPNVSDGTQFMNGVYAKGGDISVYNLRKGDKVKTRKGDIETILRKTGSGSYETIENDYSHSPESLEFVSRPSRKMADGGGIRSQEELNKIISEKDEKVKGLTPKQVAEMWNENSFGVKEGISKPITVEEAKSPTMKMYLRNLLIENELTEDEYNEYFESGGSVKKKYYFRDAKELSEDEKFELKVIIGLSGWNDGKDLNGLYHSMFLSNYRFGKSETQSDADKVEKALNSLIKKGFVDRGGLGYKNTRLGLDYKSEFNPATYAKGGAIEIENIKVGDWLQNKEYKSKVKVFKVDGEKSFKKVYIEDLYGNKVSQPINFVSIERYKIISEPKRDIARKEKVWKEINAYADGGSFAPNVSDGTAFMDNAYFADGGGVSGYDNSSSEKLHAEIKSRVVRAIGIDSAIEFYDAEYPIRPYQLLQNAVRKGFITLDEINERVIDSAMETAQDSEDMEEIGSSDETYAMQEFLDEAGFKTVFVQGRLLREYADGGSFAPNVSDGTAFIDNAYFADGGFMNDVYAKGGSLNVGEERELKTFVNSLFNRAKNKIANDKGLSLFVLSDTVIATKDSLGNPSFYLGVKKVQNSRPTYVVGSGFLSSEMLVYESYKKDSRFLETESIVEAKKFLTEKVKKQILHLRNKSVMANGGMFDNNDGFMPMKNGNNYRYPEKEVYVETIDEPIDLTSNIGSMSDYLKSQYIEDEIDFTDDKRIRARLTQPKRGSAESFSKINPRAYEFINSDLPMPTSNTHKND
jgi:ribosomal protein L20/predicted transcriptional regulator